MRILVLTKYGPLAASSRQRFVQYLPYIEAEGGEVEISPLLDDGYLSRLFDGRKASGGDFLISVGRRIRKLLELSRFDVVMIQYELFPYLPGFVDATALGRHPAVVMDFDDAIFHQYDAHRSPLVRGMLGRKLQPLLRRTSVAFCGNEYLQQYVRQFCSRTEIVPTVLDVAHFRPPGAAAGEEATVGWIGSPSTWQMIRPLVPLLQELSREHGHSNLIVGAGPQASPTEHMEFVPWSESAEVALIQRMGIGVMPLPDTQWARGKCGYKLIQYMACGLPVVASPVGVNSRIVEHGVNGFLAETEAEWRDALVRLLSDRELRVRMGAAGRRRVEAEYSIQVYGPKVARILADLAMRVPARP